MIGSAILKTAAHRREDDDTSVLCMEYSVHTLYNTGCYTEYRVHSTPYSTTRGGREVQSNDGSKPFQRSPGKK